MSNDDKKKTTHIQLIPAEERKGAVCAKCGTTLSVKYKLSDGSKERYCNRCILLVCKN